MKEQREQYKQYMQDAKAHRDNISFSLWLKQQKTTISKHCPQCDEYKDVVVDVNDERILLFCSECKLCLSSFVIS